MRNLAIPLLALVTTLTAAHATTTALPCPLSFAFLTAAEGDGPELAVEAYWRLFEQLEKGRLSPATLSQMTDPFVVPEDPAAGDLFALRRDVQRLRELLAVKHWDTPELRQGLLAELKQRGVARKDAADHQRAVNEQRPTLTAIPISTPRRLVFSPDRRWVIAIKPGAAAGSLSLDVYDFEKGTLTNVAMPSDYAGIPWIYSAGDRVLFQENNKVDSVPFHDGVLDWSKRNFLMNNALALSNFGGVLTDSAGVFYSVVNGELHRFDLASDKKSVEVSPPPSRYGVTAQRGSVPGTDQAYFVQMVETGYRLHVGRVNEKGEVPLVQGMAEWPGDPGRLYFSGDGKKILSSYAPHRVWLQAWGGKAPPHELVSARTKTTDFGRTIVGVAMSPARSEGYVFVRGPNGGRLHMEKVNLLTNEAEWSYAIPRAPEEFEEPPTISADGNLLLFREDGGAVFQLDLKLINRMLKK